MDPVCIASANKKSRTPNANDLLPEYTEDEKNPFALLNEDEFRCKEAGKKLLNNGGEEGLPVWKKGNKHNTGSSSSSLRTALCRPKSLSHRNNGGGVRKSKRKDDEQIVILRSGRAAAATPNAGSMIVERNEKESIYDLITKKREIFLMRMNIENKRDAIRNIKEKSRKEEEGVVKSRHILEDDTRQIEITLKENKDMADAAVKQSEYVTQLRKNKSMKAEGLQKEIEAIEMETVKNQQELKKNLQYKAFLDEPTLKSWLEQNRMQQQQQQKKKQVQGLVQPKQHSGQQQPKEHDDEASRKSTSKTQSRNQETTTIGVVQQTAVSKKITNGVIIPSCEENNHPMYNDIQGGERCSKDDVTGGAKNKTTACSLLNSPMLELEGKSNVLLASSNRDEELSSSETLMDFRDPQQLLEILHVMEERNLNLIQNKQETEQALDKQKRIFKDLEQAMEAKTSTLATQIAHVETAINQEKTKVDQLRQHTITLVRDSLNKQDIVTNLHAEVRNIYEGCGFDYSTATPTTLYMLGDLEVRLEDLFASTARLPASRVMKARKEREKMKRVSNQSRNITRTTPLQKEQNRKTGETNRSRVVNNKTGGVRSGNRTKPSLKQPRRSVYDGNQWKRMVIKEQESATASDNESKYL